MVRENRLQLRELASKLRLEIAKLDARGEDTSRLRIALKRTEKQLQAVSSTKLAKARFSIYVAGI